MQSVNVKGLVIRTVDLREADRLCVIFTEEMGIVTAVARGARCLRSKQLCTAAQFCYCQFVLTRRGEYYWIKEADLIESFFDLRRSIDGLALASYICEVLSDVTVAEADRELLRLSLNSLYAIARDLYPLDKIKAVFELRAAAILGFLPDVLACRVCGKKTGEFVFDIMGGNIVCADCRRSGEAQDPYDDGHEAHIICLLSEGAKVALGYCVYSPLEKVFSFRLPPEDMALLCRAAEAYLLHHLERSFPTLDFYKEVKRK